MKVEIFIFLDADGKRHPYATLDPDDARSYAMNHTCKCVTLILDVADTEVAWDFTAKEDTI